MKRQAEKGRKTIVNAIIGIVVVLLAYVVINVIVNLVTTNFRLINISWQKQGKEMQNKNIFKIIPILFLVFVFVFLPLGAIKVAKGANPYPEFTICQNKTKCSLCSYTDTTGAAVDGACLETYNSLLKCVSSQTLVSFDCPGVKIGGGSNTDCGQYGCQDENLNCTDTFCSNCTKCTSSCVDGTSARQEEVQLVPQLAPRDSNVLMGLALRELNQATAWGTRI